MSERIAGPSFFSELRLNGALFGHHVHTEARPLSRPPSFEPHFPGEDRVIFIDYGSGLTQSMGIYQARRLRAALTELIEDTQGETPKTQN